MMAIKTTIEKNFFPALARALPSRAERIVGETRHDIAAMARRLVPIDTGELQRSIHVTPTGVEADADHAAIIEYGRPPNRPAQPYLTPAAEYHRPLMLARLSERELFAETDL